MRTTTERGAPPARKPPRTAAPDDQPLLATVSAVRRLEAAGRRVVGLHVGEPRFATAPHVVAAAQAALQAGETHYAPAAGLPALREAVAAQARGRGIAHADAAHVVVTSGAKPMLMYAVLAVVRPGDVVLVPDPGFPTYAALVRLAGGVPRTYRADPRRGLAVDVEHLASRLDARVRAVVVNAPHNPTGATLDRDTLAAIGRLAEEHDLTVISDEIYHRTGYDGAPTPSAASEPALAARTIVVDGVSKAYAMTGWRLGWGILPPALAARATALVAHSTSCVPPFVQRAGVAALGGPQESVDAMVAELRARRDLLVGGLRAIPGVRCRSPRGAFYAWADVRAALAEEAAADAVAARLLDEAGVACFAGTAFGRRGAGHLRFSFGAEPAELADGIARLQAWFAGQGERERAPSVA
jgi:aspartate/methionine/tyrosine aminotransferase